MFKKSIILLLIVFSVVFLIPLPGFTSTPVSVTINEVPLSFDVPPTIIKGRTLVPLRAIFEAFGATMVWDGETRTVTATKGQQTIILTIDSKEASKNQQKIYLDVPATIIKGRTLVPTRFIAESLGAVVDWDGTTRTVKITKEGVSPPVGEQVEVLRSVVTSVVDGDTIKVNINGTSEAIRIIGIDTPETVHPSKPVELFGPEASAFAKNHLENKQVWLELDVDERCRFGRLLAYVWIYKPVSDTEAEVRSKMFNAMILLEGLAEVSTFPPNVKYVDMFTKFQKEARELGRGIWGAEQPPEATPEMPSEQTGDIIIQSVDLFGELVIIKNTSDAGIDMTGWRLVSVEGNQTFTFPAGFVLKANSTVEIDSGPGAAGDGVNSLRWTGSHIWNNDGDPAELYDAQNNKVAEY